MTQRETEPPRNPPTFREPEIDGDRCVHALAVGAACRACVDVCPHEALILDDARLGIDTEACDGCGICAGACPQAAISLPHAAPVSGTDDPATAWAACEKAVPAGEKGVLPCLQALGRDDLARLYAAGTRRLFIAMGECATCPRGARGAADALERALDDLKRLLADRHLPGMVVETIAAPAWRVARDRSTRPSRRGLLMGWRTGEGSIADNGRRRPAAAVLPAGTHATADPPLQPVVPIIDTTRCEACDACARVCPQGAIRLDPGGAVTASAPARTGIAAYDIDAAICTGCGLCVDICDAGAMSLAVWQRTQPARVALDTKQCAACGNVFRVVAGQGAQVSRCRICSRANTNGRLFQVLK